MELMRWSSLVDDYGKELREGSPDSPATDVFTYSEEGEKRWQDLKNRVVEHVCCTGCPQSSLYEHQPQINMHVTL